MGNPITDYMVNWLNTVYKYIDETGGPTYGPPYPKVTVGPDVLPTGPYSTVEEYPIDYGHVPLPFNPNATGIPATANSQAEVIIEEAKQNPPPTTFSKYFGVLYGDMMNACIADQKERHNNPNALNACRNFAERGDSSGMILSPYQKEVLGIKTVIQNENDKPDDVRLAENEETLTGMIGTGAKNLWDKATGQAPPDKIEDGADLMESPEGVNFQDLGKRVLDYIPKLPDVPGVNSGSLVMIGGGIVLLILVIAVLK